MSYVLKLASGYILLISTFIIMTIFALDIGFLTNKEQYNTGSFVYCTYITTFHTFTITVSPGDSRYHGLDTKCRKYILGTKNQTSMDCDNLPVDCIVDP